MWAVDQKPDYQLEWPYIGMPQCVLCNDEFELVLIGACDP